MPNGRSLSSIVAEIALIQFSFVVLKGPSNCSKHADGSKGQVSRDELESSRQSGRMETLQAVNESDLHGRPGTRGEDSGPSYLWQEAMKHTTAGTLLRRQLKTARR